MSYFDKFITDGNEKADELAKASFFTRQNFEKAMLDDGLVAEKRQRQ